MTADGPPHGYFSDDPVTGSTRSRGERLAGAVEDAGAALHGRPPESPPPDLPLLFLDVDGVISLFGFPNDRPPPGQFHFVDGISHCIGDRCATLLERLLDRFEVVWATGWEEKADEYLPHLLELPSIDLPVLVFGGRARFGSAHWKIDAIDEYADDRPAAWIDDNLDEACERWARDRDAPTLLVRTDAPTGLTEDHVEQLLTFADRITGNPPPTARSPDAKQDHREDARNRTRP